MRFNPGCTCCGIQCSDCANLPEKYRTIFSGITNNVCTDCANVNGTWDFSRSGESFFWTGGPGTPVLCCGYPLANCSWLLFCSDSAKKWYLCIYDPTFGCNDNSRNMVRYSTSATWNCLGSNTLTKEYETSDCSGFPTTITVDAVAGNEKQTVQQSGAIVSFTLTFDGQTTTSILGGASAADIDTALEALSTIGTGNVSCTGGPLGTATVVIEFVGSLANTAVPQITASSIGTGTIVTGTSEGGCCNVY